jgi:hypothetical protein
VAKKCKSQPSAGKIMLPLFWDMEGEILIHFIPKGENFNSQMSICLVQCKEFYEEEDFHPMKKPMAPCKIG